MLLLLFLLFCQNQLSTTFVHITQEESAQIRRTCGLRPGYKDYGRKIFHGRKAKPMQFPWIVEISEGYGQNFYHVCGGSLITKRHVLTAAHCVHDESCKNVLRPESLQVNVGNLHVLQGTAIAIYEVASHHNWHLSPFGACKPGGDLALLELVHEVPQELFEQGTAAIVCLPERDQSYTKHDFLALGWGRTLNKETREELMWTKLPPMPYEECKRRYSDVPKDVICTYEINANVCSGDSGSPLLQMTKYHRKAIFGLVSLGSNCTHMKIQEDDDEVEYPGGVFTDVRPYLNWICENTGACYTIRSDEK